MSTRRPPILMIIIILGMRQTFSFNFSNLINFGIEGRPFELISPLRLKHVQRLKKHGLLIPSPSFQFKEFKKEMLEK